MKQEECNLSDLANSCEYLTSEKLCLAVSESEKAKAARELRCRNDEKMTCCYLCMFVLDCSTPCQFLGSNENVPLKIDYKENSVDNPTVSKQKPEEDKTETTAATYCSECHLEMSQTRTKLAIDGWKGTKNQRTMAQGKLVTKSCL